MTNQYEQMKEFVEMLQYSAGIPNNKVTIDDIYKALKSYGIPPELAGRNADPTILDQIRKTLGYEANGFIVSGWPSVDDWQEFRTVSRYGSPNNSFKGKMYVPIKPGQIGIVYDSVIKFLTENNIVALGKVSLKYSSDSLIINFINPIDANKVMNFVTDRFRQSLGQHNPFIPDYNGVGFIKGQDENTSYTERVSSHLAKFVEACKNINRVDLITIDNFLFKLQDAYENGKATNPLETKQIIDNILEIKQQSSKQEEVTGNTK